MDEKLSVPYIVYEGEMARNERHVRRLITLLIVTVALLFASNTLWLYFINQYEIANGTSQDVTIDSGEGIANFIGSDGSIVNGTDSRSND